MMFLKQVTLCMDQVTLVSQQHITLHAHLDLPATSPVPSMTQMIMAVSLATTQSPSQKLLKEIIQYVIVLLLELAKPKL